MLRKRLENPISMEPQSSTSLTESSILESPTSRRRVSAVSRRAFGRKSNFEDIRNSSTPPSGPFPKSFFLKKVYNKSNVDMNENVQSNISPPSNSSRYVIYDLQAKRLILSSKQRVNRTAPPIFQNRRHNELSEMYQHKATMLTGSMLSLHYNSDDEKYYIHQCFNRFEPVGVGSFGYVVKARSLDDQKYYAIKFSKEAFHSLKNRENEINELKKQCLIPHHRNLANIYCAWEEKGRIFVQMKLGDNGCLARLAADHRRCYTQMPEKLVWSFFTDILLGVAFLHENNFIHSDIKPDNVFITSDNVCILGDFSNVIFLNDEVNNKYSDSFGDGKYLAPEFSCGMLSKKSDIYSLGVSLIEISIIIPLPSSPRELRVKDKINSKYAKAIYPSLLNIVEEMTSPLPDKRPSTADLLASDPVQLLMNFEQRNTYAKLNL